MLAQYFGNVVASSSRTPPAQRVQAALAGGLFRSPAAVLNPSQVRAVCRPDIVNMARLSRACCMEMSPCIHACIRSVDSDSIAQFSMRAARMLARCWADPTAVTVGAGCCRWA